MSYTAFSWCIIAGCHNLLTSLKFLMSCKYMWMYFLKFTVFICDKDGLFLFDFSLQKKINKNIIKKHRLTAKIWWLIWSCHTFCTPKSLHFHLIFAIYVSNNKLSRNWGYLTKPWQNMKTPHSLEDGPRRSRKYLTLWKFVYLPWHFSDF